jgi:hypothetical protein
MAAKRGRHVRAILTALILAAGVPQAAAADDSKVRSLPAGAMSPPARIADVAWLAGRWVGEGLGGAVEEVYSPATGNVMVGHFQMAKSGAVQFFELVQFREEKGSLVYRVKHFNPDLKGWEEKNATVDFPLVAIEGGSVYFDGLTIERISDNKVIHWVLLGDGKGGNEVAQFTYRRTE